MDKSGNWGSQGTLTNLEISRPLDLFLNTPIVLSALCIGVQTIVKLWRKIIQY